MQKKLDQVHASEDMLIIANFQKKDDLKMFIGAGGPYHRKPGETYEDFERRAIDGTKKAVPFGAFPVIISGGNHVDE